MFGLILSIIGIALMSGVLYAGISYINVDAYTSQLKETTVNNDLYIYSTLIKTYKSAYNVYPNTGTWESDLQKLKGNLPLNDDGYYSYEYNVSDYSIGICFSNSVNEEEMKGINNIHDRGMTILSSSCFDKTNQVIDESSFPVSIALTHWIKE